MFRCCSRGLRLKSHPLDCTTSQMSISCCSGKAAVVVVRGGARCRRTCLPVLPQHSEGRLSSLCANSSDRTSVMPLEAGSVLQRPRSCSATCSARNATTTPKEWLKDKNNVFALSQRLGVEPWALHLTWTWGKTQGKLSRLQEAKLWKARRRPDGSPPCSSACMSFKPMCCPADCETTLHDVSVT